MKNYQFISLVVLILLGIGSTHYVISKIPEKVTSNILKIEYDKVGWMKNYMKLNEIQRKQTELFLKQYEAQNGKIKIPKQEENTNKISLEQAKKITKEWTYILWNPNAEVTWVEYSDLECPFCKRLHESWTIEEILKNYNWKVNFIYKQFPLVQLHPQAPMEAEAALCVWELAWAKKYYEFIQKVYEGSEARWNSYTKESISKLWWTIWIPEKKLLSCIESGKFKDRVQAEIKEGSSLFRITWTPGNVLINNKTGKWDKLPWAYPASAFKQKIDSLLSN